MKLEFQKLVQMEGHNKILIASDDKPGFLSLFD